MLINYKLKLQKLMPCSQIFNVMFKKQLADLRICYLPIPYILCLYCSGSICFISQSVHYTETCFTCFAKFSDHAHTTQLFQWIKMLQFAYQVSLEKCFFINRWFSLNSYTLCYHLYTLVTLRHNRQTRFTEMYSEEFCYCSTSMGPQILIPN